MITEGPLDAIAIAIASETSRYAPVALCGIVLTARQVSALAGACDLNATGVLVAFDGDAPGQRAAARAYQLLRPHASRIEAVALHPGGDPAQLLRASGPAALASALACRRHPLADLAVDAAIEKWSRWLTFAEGRVAALRCAAPIIAALPPPEVGRQVARIAARLDLDHATVTEAVTDALPETLSATMQFHLGRAIPQSVR